ncbi:hypothetical protein [Planctomyces sp. SH-PL14]|uniref:hypothetical protein n=1 Tax=Planctomyces sp. SH-PL14 TaxID=1632864 RepID=UPI00078DC766|nr:hypothetical protein [Planctomyces sp. SH-PL14]AMV20395.1 hypothetical protein VT03_21030 [Planctomyces sp. SH-PL14]
MSQNTIAPAGSHRDKVATAIVFVIMGGFIGCGLLGFDAAQPPGTGNPWVPVVGYGVILVAALFLGVTTLNTLAAAADYLKQIADQQSAAIARKQGAAAPPKAPSEADRFADSLASSPPPAYKGRALGKPDL